MNMLYIILIHVVWRFREYNYFREIVKFRDFMNTLRNFAKSVFAHIFAKFEYFVKVIYCKVRIVIIKQQEDRMFYVDFNSFYKVFHK